MMGLLSTQLSEAPQHSGIYAIYNSVNGKMYVGSAMHIQKRWKRHVYLLTRGNHHSQKLQNAWNKYGQGAFRFRVTESCGEEQLISREQAAIDACDAAGRGYNILPTAGCLEGRKHTEEIKAKIGAAHKGKVITPEARAKISHALTGKVPTLETRAKTSTTLKGRIITPEHRAKISASRKGGVFSPQHRANLSAARKRRVITPETKAKLRAVMVDRMATPEARAKIGAALKGKKLSQKTRAKMSEAQRGRVLSLESIAKRTATRAANRQAQAQPTQNTKNNPLKE